MATQQDKQPEHAEWSDAALDAEPVLSHRVVHRLGWVMVAILILVLLTVLPPLLNVSRYQRRVAQAISASINRSVHFDTIHLHLLPLPGLTIQNFVVDEDPAFGHEPALRANTVEARLRLASLWRRRVEVSHITLQAPSINLVRRADGRWNLQGVITEASSLESAPTAQGRAGTTPRFPYIEATDARINIKAGDTKLPWSLLDTRLALWLPDQNEWRIRLRGRPLRTDTDVSDVGDLQLEGSLGRGSPQVPGGVLNQPLAISAKWASTPLGETAKLLLGRDTGFRGAASAEVEVRGTPAHMQIASDMHLHNLRRAEFVPRLPMSLDAHCQGEATGIVHALHNVRCAIPTAQSDSLLQGVFRNNDEHVLSAPDVLSVQAELPDVLNPSTAVATFDLQKAQPEYVLNWLRVFSSRIPDAAAAHGAVNLRGDWNTVESRGNWTLYGQCRCTLEPAYPRAVPANGTEEVQARAEAWTMQAKLDSSEPIRSLTSPQALTTALLISARRTPADQPSAGTAAPGNGRRTAPAMEQIDPTADVFGSVDGSGSVLHYASYDVARYAASLLPPLGDYMPVPAPGQLPPSGALLSERAWSGPQHWVAQAAPPAPAPKQHRRAHR